MIRKQKIAIVVGAVVIALLALFPPWAGVHTWLDATPDGDGGVVHVRECIEVVPYGHHLVFANPLEFDRYEGIQRAIYGDAEPTEFHAPRIDFSVLLLLQGTALVLTAAAVLVLRDRKP